MTENQNIRKSYIARLLLFSAPVCYLLYYLLQGRYLLLGNTDRPDAQLAYLFAAKNALANGQMPWWNPYIFNGTPLWGNPAFFLWYPLTWIELLSPLPLTLYVSTLISWFHYFGVFLTAFLYFRVLVGDEKWASFSALAYGFSISVAYGLAVGNSYLPIYVFLPLCLYFLHSHHQRSSRQNISFITISLYCMFTGGFLQMLIYAMTILLSYVLFLGYQSNSYKEAFSLIKMFAASLLIALLLSAPSWISILYMAGFVSRVSSADTSWHTAVSNGIVTPISTLLRLFMPNGFGFDMHFPYNYVETTASFCGISSLFLAGLAVVHRPNKTVYYWAAVSLAILLLCFTKLLVIQYLIFGGVEIMYGRLLFLLPLGVASLAGIEGKNLSENHIPQWWLLILNPFNIILLLVYISNTGLIARLFENVFSMMQRFIETKTLKITRSNIPEFEFLRTIIVFLSVASVITYINRQKTKLIWGTAVLILLIEVVPSTYLMHKIQLNPLMTNPSRPFFAFDKIKSPLPLSASELKEFRVVITEEVPSRRAYDSPPFAKESNQGAIYLYQSPWGYANGYSTHLATLIRTTGTVDLNPDCESGGLINGVKDILNNASRQVIFDPLCHSRLSDLMSVGAVIKADKEWRIIADRRAIALRRVSLFYNYEVISNTVDASNRLAQENFNIHKTLILEQKPRSDVGPADPKARSIIIKNTPNEVIIQADSNTPVLLLLTDTYSPGWTVEIDGQPGEIIRANVAFRSVWVPKGDHTVTFQYNPPLLGTSLLLELLGISILLGMLVSAFLKIPRRATPRFVTDNSD